MAGRISAYFVDEVDAGQIGKPAEQSGPQTGDSEGQSEEETGDHANFTRRPLPGRRPRSPKRPMPAQGR